MRKPFLTSRVKASGALAVTLGILTSMGGFVDVGEFVASAQSGAR